MFCHVAAEQVFGVHDVASVYHVPLLLRSQGIIQYLTDRLKLDKISLSPEMKEKGRLLEKRWEDMTSGYENDTIHFPSRAT